jgi:hypothetical protein
MINMTLPSGEVTRILDVGDLLDIYEAGVAGKPNPYPDSLSAVYMWQRGVDGLRREA